MEPSERIKELRASCELSQSQYAMRFGIPKRTLQDWEIGRRTPPPYIIYMMESILELERKVDILRTKQPPE